MSCEVYEYLNSIKIPIRKLMTEELFDNAIAIIYDMNMRDGSTCGLPPVIVTESNDLEASTIFGSIQISKGTFEHCLGSETVYIDSLFPSFKGIEFDYMLVARSALMWILAHEWTHARRKHDEVSKQAMTILEDHDESAISHALEHDADLCAISAIYRKMQTIFGSTLPDIDIRKIVTYCLFFSLRTVPWRRSHSHAPMDERLYHMAEKMIQLPEVYGSKIATDFIAPESKSRGPLILDAFARCEKAFLEKQDMSLDGNLLERWEKYFNSNSHTPIMATWQAISPIVQRLSGTLADNNPGANLKYRRVQEEL